MSYYTLIIRRPNVKKWGIEFGDYSKQTVLEEQEQFEYDMSNQGEAYLTKVIRTNTALQRDIQEQINIQNDLL